MISTIWSYIYFQLAWPRDAIKRGTEYLPNDIILDSVIFL